MGATWRDGGGGHDELNEHHRAKPPYCGARRKLIALLADGLVVRKILAHLGLSTDPPALAPARAPPEPVLVW